MDRASATKRVDSSSIPGRVKPKTIGLVFTASLFDVQQLKGQYEVSAVCCRQEGRWRLARRPKGPFAVSCPRQLGEQNVITIAIT